MWLSMSEWHGKDGDKALLHVDPCPHKIFDDVIIGTFTEACEDFPAGWWYRVGTHPVMPKRWMPIPPVDEQSLPTGGVPSGPGPKSDGLPVNLGGADHWHKDDQ